MSRSSLIFLLAVCSFGAYQSWRHRQFDQVDGVLIAERPQQRAQSASIEEFAVGDFKLQPKARYELDARLLSRERYWVGDGASLAPLDFAVGWGPMSDNAVLAELDISQSNRFFHVSWKVPPLPVAQIMGASANMHLIPANHKIGRRLDSMRPGQLVRLRGSLVDARREDGWIWKTSLTRDDNGPGACELMWVEYAEVLQ